MCDYSLEHQISRHAQAGDRLETTAFTNASTRGFCTIDDRNVAVCLRPGTEIAFDAPVVEEGFMRLYHRVHNHHALHTTFCEVNAGNPNAHHDALEFPDGRIVLLTRLQPGQRATVLVLPVNEAKRNVGAGAVPAERAPAAA